MIDMKEFLKKAEPGVIVKVLKENAVWYRIAVAAAAIDLCLKHFAEKQYKEENPDNITAEAQDYFDLDSEYKEHKGFRFKEVIHNSGFAGERMKKHPGIVAFVAAVFTMFIAGRIPFLKKKSKKLGWALILGGALSNTLDRVRHRYVVDYLPFRKYVYNVGDLEIYTGAAMITAAEILDKDED